MNSRGPKLLAVGDCCVDEYEGECSFPGGNALNVAAAWKRRGADSSFMGAVGDDEAGSWLLKEIEAAGLDPSHTTKISGRTGLTEIRLDREGERQIVAERFGVSEDFAVGAEESEAFGDVDWVHGALSPTAQDLIEAFRAEGRGLSFDFSTNLVTSGLDGLDVAFYSWEGQPSPETDAVLESALQAGASVAVAMCGRYGSRAATAEQRVSLDGNEIDVVDTCGAGDAYIASFIVSRLNGAGLEESMRAGRSAGEETCLTLGAWLNHRTARVAK